METFDVDFDPSVLEAGYTFTQPYRFTMYGNLD